MGRHCAPGRPRSVASVIGGGAGAIGVAALVAALDAVVAPVAGGMTAVDDRAHVAPVSSEAPWQAGPLELPGIGVVAPDFEAAYTALDVPAPSTTAAATPTRAPAPSTPQQAITPEETEEPTGPAARTPPAPTPTRTPAPAPADQEPDAPPPDSGTTTPPSPKPKPPVEKAPAEEPPTDEPPAEEPPTEEPAGEEPSAEEPHTEKPPAEKPPAEEPPAEEPPVQEPPVQEPPVQEPPVQEPAVVEDLAVGGELRLTDPATGAVVATVVVSEIVVDVACTAEGATAAQNGHLVAVRVRMVTGAAAPGGLALHAGSFTVADGAGSAVGPVGTAAGEACLTDAEAFPAGPLAADASYAGTVVLDVPVTTGTVTYRPDPAGAGGRWTFGPG